MAEFLEAYRKTEINEGGYANVKGDRGGETYAGIARNTSPANLTLPPPVELRKLYIRITSSAATITLSGTLYDYSAGSEVNVASNFDALFRNGGGMIQATGGKWYVILSN